MEYYITVESELLEVWKVIGIGLLLFSKVNTYNQIQIFFSKLLCNCVYLLPIH